MPASGARADSPASRARAIDSAARAGTGRASNGPRGARSYTHARGCTRTRSGTDAQLGTVDDDERFGVSGRLEFHPEQLDERPDGSRGYE